VVKENGGRALGPEPPPPPSPPQGIGEGGEVLTAKPGVGEPDPATEAQLAPPP